MELVGKNFISKLLSSFYWITAENGESRVLLNS